MNRLALLLLAGRAGLASAVAWQISEPPFDSDADAYAAAWAAACPTDYLAEGVHDPDWIASPVDAPWGLKCYRDATETWGEKPWQFCFEVCQNGIYCGGQYCGGTANLASVMSAEEEQWIADNFASGSDHPTTGNIWLGYGYITPESVDHYMQTPADPDEGVWAWLGWPSSYTNWAGSDPDHGCAAMTGDGSSGWVAQTCTVSARCLCELALVQPPAPPHPPPGIESPAPPSPAPVGCVDTLTSKKGCKKKHCSGKKAKKCMQFCGMCDEDGNGDCEDKKGDSWCGKKTKGSKAKKFCKNAKKAKKCELSCDDEVSSCD